MHYYESEDLKRFSEFGKFSEGADGRVLFLTNKQSGRLRMAA